MSTPFDPGLQPERVALSWQRTAMAIAVGSLVYARIVSPSIGVWALAPALAGLALAILMGFRSRHRYEHHHRTLTSRQGNLADGRFLGFVAACVCAAGMFAFVLTLLN